MNHPETWKTKTTKKNTQHGMNSALGIYLAALDEGYKLELTEALGLRTPILARFVAGKSPKNQGMDHNYELPKTKNFGAAKHITRLPKKSV